MSTYSNVSIHVALHDTERGRAKQIEQRNDALRRRHEFDSRDAILRDWDVVVCLTVSAWCVQSGAYQSTSTWSYDARSWCRFAVRRRALGT